MSQVRYRMAALALGGLFLGVPLLTNGTASAEQIGDGGGRQVVFGGGSALGLSCRSTPSVGTMTVPAESTVQVVNQTGHAARLTLGGTPRGTLPDDGATAVVFRRGTTAVLLSPGCARGTEPTPLLVTATPQPIPTPPEGAEETPAVDAATVLPTDAETPATTGTGITMPGTTSSPVRPTRTVTVTRRPVTTRPATARPATARPATTRPATTRAITPATAARKPATPRGGAATTKVRTRLPRGTRAAAPTPADLPPGDRKTVVPPVPAIEVPTISGAAVSEASVAPISATPSDVAGAEPVAQMRPMPERQPVGMLAMIAGVCALGVVVATIRSFVSQRASRANIA